MRNELTAQIIEGKDDNFIATVYNKDQMILDFEIFDSLEDAEKAVMLVGKTIRQHFGNVEVGNNKLSNLVCGMAKDPVVELRDSGIKIL